MGAHAHLQVGGAAVRPWWHAATLTDPCATMSVTPPCAEAGVFSFLIWYGGGERGRISPLEKCNSDEAKQKLFLREEKDLPCLGILYPPRRRVRSEYLSASQGRSATARGGVAEFSSRKISVIGRNARRKYERMKQILLQ